MGLASTMKNDEKPLVFKLFWRSKTVKKPMVFDHFCTFGDGVGIAVVVGYRQQQRGFDVNGAQNRHKTFFACLDTDPYETSATPLEFCELGFECSRNFGRGG